MLRSGGPADDATLDLDEGRKGRVGKKVIHKGGCSR